LLLLLLLLPHQTATAYSLHLTAYYYTSWLRLKAESQKPEAGNRRPEAERRKPEARG